MKYEKSDFIAIIKKGDIEQIKENIIFFELSEEYLLQDDIVEVVQRSLLSMIVDICIEDVQGFDSDSDVSIPAFIRERLKAESRYNSQQIEKIYRFIELFPSVKAYLNSDEVLDAVKKVVYALLNECSIEKKELETIGCIINFPNPYISEAKMEIDDLMDVLNISDNIKKDIVEEAVQDIAQNTKEKKRIEKIKKYFNLIK